MNNRRVNGHGSSISIGAAASLLTPGYLIEAYSVTHGYQRQRIRAFQSPIREIPLILQVDDLSIKCIDPRLLCISIKTLQASTFDTQPDLGMFPPPTPAPIAAAYREGYHATVPSIHRPFYPPLLEAPARRARSNDRVCTQSSLRVTRFGWPHSPCTPTITVAVRGSKSVQRLGRFAGYKRF